MKPIEKDELYEHLSGFLKNKGVELKEGSYARRVQQGCNLLAEAINLSHKGLGKAKAEIDKGLDRMRRVIHEKTAPRTPGKAAARPAAKPTPPRPSKARAKRAKKRAGAGARRG